ncbi:MAG: hypothetical protein ACT4OP_00850 [Actinomycetota bacterium]
MTGADARVIALEGLIDYAGMYPPESLSLAEALFRYQKHRGGDHAWMLGVFLCPSSQLTALAGRVEESGLPIGVVADQAVVEAVASTNESGLEITHFELATGVESAPDLEGLRRDISLFIEAEVAEVATLALELAPRPVAAKVRLGGSTPAYFPDPGQVAAYLSEVASAGLAVKATAGLHHPWRHFSPDLGAWRHGFLNLVGAAALLENGGRSVEAEVILEAETGRLDASALSVAGFDFGPQALAIGRSFLPSYGSCSFDEPLDDLLAMSAIPGRVH